MEAAAILGETIAGFGCSIDAEIPAGDHTPVLLTPHDAWVVPTARPLVFHGSAFRRLDQQP